MTIWGIPTDKAAAIIPEKKTRWPPAISDLEITVTTAVERKIERERSYCGPPPSKPRTDKIERAVGTIDAGA